MSVHPVQTKQSADASHAELQSLKDEVKELKTKLASCMPSFQDVKEKSYSALPVSTIQPSEHSGDTDLAALKKQRTTTESGTKRCWSGNLSKTDYSHSGGG